MPRKATSKHTARRRAGKRQLVTRRTVGGMALLSGRQISFETGMGLRSVYDEMNAGNLPYKQVGNRRYVSRPVFEEWLANWGKGTAA